MKFDKCYSGVPFTTDVHFGNIRSVTHFEYGGDDLFDLLLKLNPIPLRYIKLFDVGDTILPPLRALLLECDNLEYLEIDGSVQIEMNWLDNCRFLKTLKVKTNDHLYDLKNKDRIECLGDTKIDEEFFAMFPNLIHAHCRMEPTEKSYALESCWADPWTNFEKMAKSFPFIKHLVIPANCINVTLKGLNRFKYLKHLELKDYVLDFDTKCLDGLKNLEVLDISCHGIDVGSLGLYCPNLKNVTIVCDVEIIGDFQEKLSNLDSVSIECRQTPLSKETTTILLNDASLEEFSLHTAEFIDDEFIFENKNIFKNATYLDLEGCNLTKVGFGYLLDHTPNLKELDFESHKCSIEAAKEIINDVKPLLKYWIYMSDK